MRLSIRVLVAIFSLLSSGVFAYAVVPVAPAALQATAGVTSEKEAELLQCSTPPATTYLKQYMDRLIVQIDELYRTNAALKACGVNNRVQVFGQPLYVLPESQQLRTNSTDPFDQASVSLENAMRNSTEAVANTYNQIADELQNASSEGFGISEFFSEMVTENISFQLQQDSDYVRRRLDYIRELMARSSLNCADGVTYSDELLGELGLYEGIKANYYALRQMYFLLLRAPIQAITEELDLEPNVQEVLSLEDFGRYIAVVDMLYLRLLQERSEGLESDVPVVETIKKRLAPYEQDPSQRIVPAIGVNPFWYRTYSAAALSACPDPRLGIQSVENAFDRLTRTFARMERVFTSFQTVGDDFVKAYENSHIKKGVDAVATWIGELDSNKENAKKLESQASSLAAVGAELGRSLGEAMKNSPENITGGQVQAGAIQKVDGTLLREDEVNCGVESSTGFGQLLSEEAKAECFRQLKEQFKLRELQKLEQTLQTTSQTLSIPLYWRQPYTMLQESNVALEGAVDALKDVCDHFKPNLTDDCG